jgi:hypothetical protein
VRAVAAHATASLLRFAAHPQVSVPATIQALVPTPLQLYHRACAQWHVCDRARVLLDAVMSADVPLAEVMPEYMFECAHSAVVLQTMNSPRW